MAHWSDFCPECDEYESMKFGDLEYEADGYITRSWKCECGAYGVDHYSLSSRDEHHENNDLKEFQKCSSCNAPTTYEREDETKPPEGEICGVCGMWVCPDCVDWKASKEGELDIVCKSCAKFYQVAQGDEK